MTHTLIRGPTGGVITDGLIAEAEASIRVPIGEVWHALTEPMLIERYMFGAKVVTDWSVDGDIRWKGVWKGTPYEDKGVVLRFDEPRLLSFTHFSPLTGEPDVPENYHTVTIRLSDDGSATRLELIQDNNANEEARDHSEQNWRSMLESLKTMLEDDN